MRQERIIYFMALISLPTADHSMFSNSSLFDNNPITTELNLNLQGGSGYSQDITDSFANLMLNPSALQLNRLNLGDLNTVNNGWINISGANLPSSLEPSKNTPERRDPVIINPTNSLNENGFNKRSLGLLRPYLKQGDDLNSVQWDQVPSDKLEQLTAFNTNNPLITNAKFELGKRYLDEASPFKQRQGVSLIEEAYESSSDPNIARFLVNLYRDGKGESIAKDLKKSNFFLEKSQKTN